MPVRVIPKILTTAEWNAKKGTIAKMAGETGIGAALAKLKTEWDKVPWDVLDPDAAMASSGRQTTKLLDEKVKGAKAAIGKLEPVRKQLIAIEKLAGDIELKWKKSKLIPSSSRAYVSTMKVEAEAFKIAMKSVDNDWKHARERIAKDEIRMKAMAMQKMKPYLASLRAFGAEVKKNPTVENYKGSGTKGFHQNVRGLNAALDRSQDDALIAWKKQNWLTFSTDQFIPQQDSEAPAKVDQVLRKVAELEALLG